MTLVNKGVHTKYREKASHWDNLQNATKNKKQCNLSSLGTTAVWSMFSIAPALSPDALSMIMPLCFMVFAEIMSLELDKEMIAAIAAIAPSPATCRWL